MTKKRSSWVATRASEIRYVVDCSISSLERRLASVPLQSYTDAGIDKAGVMRLIEQAVVHLDAVHDVLVTLPRDFGVVRRCSLLRGGRHLRGRVTLKAQYRTRYENLFKFDQAMETLTSLKTTGFVRIRVKEGEFLVEAKHLEHGR